MVEPATQPRKKIRLTRAEAYVLQTGSPRKKKLAFSLIGLLIAAALGNVLWHYQELWLPYWIPETPDATPPVDIKRDSTPQTPADSSPAPSAPFASSPGHEATPAAAANEEWTFLSAAVWDQPDFVRGVRLFNRALDAFRSSNGAPAPEIRNRIESDLEQALALWQSLQATAPPEIAPVLETYQERGRHLQETARAAAPALAAPPPPSSTPTAATNPVPPVTDWHAEYREGALLFNQALEQYQLFLKDKSRLDLLSSIEEKAFRAVKKFESLRGKLPADIPLDQHIQQTYKLISDCRRQNLEAPRPPPASR